LLSAPQHVADTT